MIMTIPAKAFPRPVTIALVVAAALLVSAKPGAAFGQKRWSRFGSLATQVTGFASDGSRYVVWQTKRGNPLVIYDTWTRRRRDVTAPAGCDLPESESGERATAAEGRVLLACNASTSEVLHAATGEITPLPQPAGPLDAGWFSIGSRYVAGTADPHVCGLRPRERESGESCVALYDLVTRALTYAPPSYVPDLDKPQQVCALLRAQLIAANAAGPAEREPSYDDGLLARPARRGSGIELLGCRGRRKILHAAGQPENIDLHGGLLTWDTAAPASAYNQEVEERPGYGFLWTYQLSTGRRTHIALPEVRIYTGMPHRGTNTLGYSTHAGSMLFWLAAQTVTADHGGYALTKSTLFVAHV